jgi:hypothetical protein
MTSAELLTKIQTRFGGFFSAQRKYEVTIYFEGPRTRFARSTSNWLFEEWRDCVRTPIDSPNQPHHMPPPHASETVATKCFRTRTAALVWALMRCEGFQNIKADVRTL